MLRRYTDTLREALPPNLVGLLDWELPLARLPDNYVDRQQPLEQTQGLAKMPRCECSLWIGISTDAVRPLGAGGHPSKKA